ncbi:MAG: hypothetical protein A2Z27_00005, partial [candidate division Zixibacteria bacterium RBG_16_50_21]
GYERKPKRDFQFWYDLRLTNLPDSSKSMTVWLPIPPSNHHQTISNLKVKSGYSYSIYQEPEYENSILKIKLSSPLPDSLVVSVNFTVARSAIATFEDNKKPSVSVSDVHLKRFLSPDRLVPIDGIIEEETYRVIKRKMSELDKAKAIYNYVSSTLDYDKSGIGWGRGDAVYACNARTGNCTDFHSLFIGMARAGGIPARFVMGFPLPQDKTEGEIAGYHCWAEFYLRGVGWIPVDASEASKHPDRHEFYFGNLDPDRVEFSIGRDISIEPKEDLEPLNFFVYPLVVLDGRVLEKVDAHFRFAESKENGTP